MAVKIKLKRLGKIRAPYYRIVVADARTKRDGRAIEEIGKYHPKAEPSFIEVNSERAQHWLSVGAQPTDPVRKILEITGDWQKFKGLPGAEGTLKMAAPREDRKAIFAAAVSETLEESTTGQKGRAKAKVAEAGKDAEERPGRAGKTAAKDAPAGKDAVTAKGDKPARAKAGGDAPAKAKAGGSPAKAKAGEESASAKADGKAAAGQAAPAEAKADAPEAKADAAEAKADAAEAKADAAPDAAAPEATAPEATAPEATGPEATAPEATVSEAAAAPAGAAESESGD